MSKGVWYKEGKDPFEHWHEYLGESGYAAISRCGMMKQRSQALGYWAEQLENGRIQEGQSPPRCRKCLLFQERDSHREH